MSTAANAARYRTSHRDEIAERNREWRAAHKDSRNAYNRDWRRARPRTIEVYVIYDADDRVVYVGRTNDFKKRLDQHERDRAGWLFEGYRVEHRYFDSYGDSLVAEAILIRDTQPKFNKDGVTR